jgi:hypothetical protein
VRDSSPPTQKRIDIPNILVVGLAADVSAQIERRISPFPVVRAADLTEATGLIAAAQPLVVVVTSARGDEEIAILRDLARTVVSEFAVFEELGPLDAACVGMERLLMRAEARRTGDPQRNDR